jgi:hypothetical protein
MDTHELSESAISALTTAYEVALVRGREPGQFLLVIAEQGAPCADGVPELDGEHQYGYGIVPLDAAVGIIAERGTPAARQVLERILAAKIEVPVLWLGKDGLRVVAIRPRTRAEA